MKGSKQKGQGSKG